jgi:hypothetical protein
MLLIAGLMVKPITVKSAGVVIATVSAVTAQHSSHHSTNVLTCGASLGVRLLERMPKRAKPTL